MSAESRPASASLAGCDPADHALPGVRALRPYQPGKPISELEREYGVRDAIKLASNENPLGASPAALAAMRAVMDDLWLYPDGGGFALRGALAERHGVDPACVTLGNGSNDVLVLLCEAFLGPGRAAVFSQFAFAVYPISTQAAGAEARVVPALPPGHDRAYGHDLDAMATAVDTDSRIVFIANPNNPTGTWVDEDALLDFLGSVPGDTLVVVDEAYHEYARPLGVPDASKWLDRFPNLVVTRTFSKAYGLAGIRVGYSLSSPAVADMLNRVRQPFNVNSLALVGAQAALGDTEFIEASVNANVQGQAHLSKGLSAMGFDVTPSAGNFLLVDMGVPATPVYEALLHEGVIVRPVANYGLTNHLRMTVGTADQNHRLLEALQRTLDTDAFAR